MISHFMCGVAVPPEMPGERPKIFHSFCKVSIIIIIVMYMYVYMYMYR